MSEAACPKPETAELHRRSVERTILAMDEQLDEELSLQEMAEIGLMSPFHFNRVFRQVTGVPPARFLTARRIETAKRLLLTTELNITDICFEVGYNSLGTFTRRFTELVGVPPRRFRKLAKAGAEAALDGLRSRLEHLPLISHGVGLSGRLEKPRSFRGVLFVGLFASALPQGRPLACTMLSTAGVYRLPPVPDGHYHLFAVGLSWSTDPREYLLYEDVPRAGRPVRIDQRQATGATDLELRRPELVDPPILMTFPPLIHERLTRIPVEPASGQHAVF